MLPCFDSHDNSVVKNQEQCSYDQYFCGAKHPVLLSTICHKVPVIYCYDNYH